MDRLSEISPDAYQALEEIVGSENISDEPVLLDAYAHSVNSYFYMPNVERYYSRPAAVVLPGSTQDVQAILKVCNRCQIKYWVSSTRWTAEGQPTDDGLIYIDLARMDRILDIDDKNQFAIVEPRVTGGQLQAEAMKRGLNTHMIGAGASCSPLASACAYLGVGPDSVFMGTSPQNLLALEWVTPTGDIVRTGSLSSGNGWFCGDGPGISLRGAIRGKIGTCGGLGVFTKCALRLYPWPGPAEVPVEGFGVSSSPPLPDNMRCYWLAFPSADAFAEAIYHLWDSEIAYLAHKQFHMFGEHLQAAMVKILSDPSKQLDDIEAVLQEPDTQKLAQEMKYSFQVIVAGMTPRDITWKEIALDELLAAVGGWRIEEMTEPHIMRWLLWYFLKLHAKNLNWSLAGGYVSSWGVGGTPDFVRKMKLIEMTIEEKTKWIQQRGGLIDLGDSSMYAIGGFGGGGTTLVDHFLLFNPSDPDILKSVRDYEHEITFELPAQRGVGTGAFKILHIPYCWPKQRIQQFLQGSKNPAFEHQRRIRQFFDPNDIGYKSYYYLEETPEK